MRDIRLIVLHCTATPDDRTLFSGVHGSPNFRTPADEVDSWHVQRGFHRDTYWRGRLNPHLKAIGYHWLIARNGALFSGRHEDEPGAHASGWNAASLGICMVGINRFEPVQWLQLRTVVELAAKRYGIPMQPPVLALDEAGKRFIRRPGICGHREIPGVAKECPGFSVADWLDAGLQPVAGHLV